MITLRPDQVRALADAAQQRRRRGLVAWFTRHYPHEPRVEAIVDEAGASAALLGIHREADVFRFTWFCFHGPRVMSGSEAVRELALRVLLDDTVPAHQRLDFLEGEVLPRAHAAAQRGG